MTEVVRFEAVRMTGIKTGKPKPVLLKNGEPSIETRSIWWAVCDVCGEGTWTSNLTNGPCEACGRANSKCRPTKGEPCCGDCEHILGLACRMTPHCEGRHRKEAGE